MTSGRLAGAFPLPLVALVALLVVLIFVTPNLEPTATPAAGTLATQAELIVDHASTGNTTNFYIQGLGLVRYAEITASVATNVSWPPPPSFTNLSWGNVTVVAGVLEYAFSSTANPVGINVTATYVDPTGASVEYYGVFAFAVSGGDLTLVPLAPGQSALGGIAPTPLNSLPLPLLLTSTTAGGAP